jgi:hypothetical protein
MSDFLLKELLKKEWEQKYWEKILLWCDIDLKKKNGLPNENDGAFYENELPARVKELTKGLDLKDIDKFTQELTAGVKQLYGKLKGIEKSAVDSVTLEIVNSVTLEIDSIKKEIDGIKYSEHYKRHMEYDQNPTLIKAVTNALHDFADYVCGIFCKHTGRDNTNSNDRKDAMLLLSKAFESFHHDLETQEKNKEKNDHEQKWKDYEATVRLINKEGAGTYLIKERNDLEKELDIGLIMSIFYTIKYKETAPARVNRSTPGDGY